MSDLSLFRNPTQISFGKGAIQEVSTIVNKEGFKRVLIITDQGIVKAGLTTRLEEQLEGIEWGIFDGCEPNPTVSNCVDALKELEKINAEAVIAIGGGSSIDVAKAVCLLATNGGSIVDYEGIDTFSNPLLPLLAIPTTAGTASEVTNFTVITDEERQYKLTVGSVKVAPKWAVLDPELTLSLPKSITAATGLDALVHAIESYTSKMANEMTKPLAREAIRKISRHLRTAVHNGESIEARENMLMGSLLAGLAFNNTRLGNCHALSHPVSAIYHVPHGIANSIIIPKVMKFNSFAAPELFADIAEDMGENIDGLNLMEKANKAVTAVEELSNDIGIPSTFKEFNMDEKYIDQMATDAMLSGNIQVNPRVTTKEDVIELYKQTIEG